MKKILILSGGKEQKNIFAKYVRFDLGIYVRHRNPYDSLKEAARLMGCKLDKSSRNYFDQIIELNTYANEHWDFKRQFAVDAIEDFLKRDQVQLLVLHGYDQEDQIVKELEEKYGAKTIHIFDEMPLLSDDKYDYVLATKDPSFQDGVKNILDFVENN